MLYAEARTLLPLQGEGWEGDEFLPQTAETHPHPNPPLEGKGITESNTIGITLLNFPNYPARSSLFLRTQATSRHR